MRNETRCHCITDLAKDRCKHYRAYECCKAEDLKEEQLKQEIMERNSITTLGELRIGDRFTFLKKDEVLQVTSTGKQVTYNQFTPEGRKLFKWDEMKSANTPVRFLRHTTQEAV